MAPYRSNLARTSSALQGKSCGRAGHRRQAAVSSQAKCCRVSARIAHRWMCSNDWRLTPEQREQQELHDERQQQLNTQQCLPLPSALPGVQRQVANQHRAALCGVIPVALPTASPRAAASRSIPRHGCKVCKSTGEADCERKCNGPIGTPEHCSGKVQRAIVEPIPLHHGCCSRSGARSVAAGGPLPGSAATGRGCLRFSCPAAARPGVATLPIQQACCCAGGGAGPTGGARPWLQARAGQTDMDM